MKFENVKCRVPSLRKTLLLNEELSVVDRAHLEDGVVIIDHVSDRLANTFLKNCKVISRVPLAVYFSHITPIGDVEHNGKIDKSLPHAIIESCYFNLCRMPKAFYDSNYIRGQSQSSE